MLSHCQSPDSFDLTHATWGEVKQCSQYHMAILPWGATEPHNGHLPYCTDVILSRDIACEVAAAVAETGLHVMVLPGIPLGSQNPGQTSLPFCLHTSQTTQYACRILFPPWSAAASVAFLLSTATEATVSRA